MKRHLLTCSLLAVLAALAAVPGFASPIYLVVIDTSSASGQAGAIYMQFQPGLNADPASVQLTAYVMTLPGVLSSVPPPEFTAGVTGGLDAPPLEIPNTLGLNYYLHYLTYGTEIRFTVSLNVPAQITGDSGSTFSFGLTAEDGITPILTTDPFGFAGEIGYDAFGTFTATPLSNVVTFVPEPGTLWLALPAAVALLMVKRRLLDHR
jgi:hypothetical protein